MTPRSGDDSATIAIKPLAPPTDRSIIFSVLSMGDHTYPPAVGHFEHWRVEADGTGSSIIIETRFASTLWGTIAILRGLWRQAGLVVSPNAQETIVGFGKPAADATTPSARPSPAKNTLRKIAPTQLPAHYGREAAISLLAFAYMLTQFDWQTAVVLALVILWHEYGHLVAYQLTGRTGNRLMLVPFFGGIAVAGAPHRNEFERAFCALMGPAICVPVTLGCFALWYFDVMPDYDRWLWSFFQLSAIVNLLNLLPIYPLDGGQAAESFLRSYFPSSIVVHLSGLAVASLVVLVALEYYQMAVFIGLFCFLGLRNVAYRSPLPAMGAWQGLLMAIFYAITVASHLSVLVYFKL
ncbi:metalloprotease [Rhizobium sp. LjRoot254]|uniref:metalloprotease n=1 Tax=Rhizobium sp. LjRoot254 TaxID=3342297 RepID=UPI003ECE1221